MAFRVDTRVLMHGVKEPILAINDPTLVKFEKKNMSSLGLVGQMTLPDGTMYVLPRERFEEWEKFVNEYTSS